MAWVRKVAFEREAAFKKAAPYGGRSPLHCHSDVMEGRGDGLKRLNLGRSIDYSCQGLQHFWVGIGVVSLCVNFVVPQTDLSDLCTAGTRECDFILKTILFTK